MDGSDSRQCQLGISGARNRLPALPTEIQRDHSPLGGERERDKETGKVGNVCVYDRERERERVWGRTASEENKKR